MDAQKPGEVRCAHSMLGEERAKGAESADLRFKAVARLLVFLNEGGQGIQVILLVWIQSMARYPIENSHSLVQLSVIMNRPHGAEPHQRIIRLRQSDAPSFIEKCLRHRSSFQPRESYST
jgi:hypothetical protein